MFKSIFEARRVKEKESKGLRMSWGARTRNTKTLIVVIASIEIIVVARKAERQYQQESSYPAAAA